VSTPTFLYFLTVLFVGMPAALRVTGFRVRVRNSTAFAMVAMWLFGQFIWWLTGEWLPVQAMILQDAAVIAAMFVKDDWCTCPYRNGWHQLACLWIERTPWDKAILVLFPSAWLFYFPVTTPTNQFWTLWGIGLAQLALAGLEALHEGRGTVGQPSRADAPGKFPGILFAPVKGMVNV
jgi:hypothetical protein